MSYYNIGARYEIVGRISKGTSVIAYMLKDKTLDTVDSVEKGVVEQLALNKQIYNCTAQVYGELVNLKGINCKLSKLPKYNEDGKLIDEVPKHKIKAEADLKIVGKMTEGRVITDYVVIHIKQPDNFMRVPKDTVLQLALDGRFVNAKAQMNGNELMLRGTQGANLNQLTTYCAG